MMFGCSPSSSRYGFDVQNLVPEITPSRNLWQRYCVWKSSPPTSQAFQRKVKEISTMQLNSPDHQLRGLKQWNGNGIPYEQRTKPITSAKGRGWNGHRFLCVPHGSWGFNVCNKIRPTICIKSHRFLCHPYRSWEFHDGIKYQCPGVTVPKCLRFWRALIWNCCRILRVHVSIHEIFMMAHYMQTIFLQNK